MLRSSAVAAVRLYGQMGNQLFQFALGRALTPADEPVALDVGRGDVGLLASAVRPEAIRTITPAEAFTLRRAPFRIGREKLQNLLDVQRLPAVRRFLDRRIYSESGWAVYDQNHRVPRPVLYVGYFQREEYFEHVKEEVASAFRPPSAEAVAFHRTARVAIGARPIVSVSIRAGADYVRLGWNPKFEWFRRAAEAAVDHLGDVGFVVSSDVPFAAEAAAAALGDLGPATQLPPAGPYDTMRAVSLCDHAIVSPSTFSWWSAWLGDHRTGFASDRLVIAPALWIEPDMQPAPPRWMLVE